MFEPIINVFPADFDGVVRFTNWTNDEFIGKWGGKNYIFPPMKTVPMLIINATPLELFGIRKKFAKELGEREFFKNDKYKEMKSLERDKNSNAPLLNSIHQANTYSLDDLAPFIQRCLEPLPLDKAVVTDDKKDKIEERLHKDEEGNLVTQAIDKNLNLRERALRGKGL